MRSQPRAPQAARGATQRPAQRAPAARKPGPDLRGMGMEAQQAALRPDAQPGFEAQRAELSPDAEPAELQSAQRALAAATTDAAEQVTEETADGSSQHDDAKSSAHPMLKRLGDKIGLGLGIAVTKVLKYVPGWDDAVVDAEGKEAHHIKGADRVGDHKLRRRHKEDVGPKILKFVAGLSPGRLREFLQGVGEGATVAPGETYRREVKAAEDAKDQPRSSWWPW